MARKRKPEKKIIKQKPRHPRPKKDIRWREKKEEKPAYKKRKKLEEEIDKEVEEERP